MSKQITQLTGGAFLAWPEMMNRLLGELTNRFHADISKKEVFGDIVYLPEWNHEGVPYWCKTAFLSPAKMTFDSIGEAASALKEIQRNWGPYQFTQFRRATLIQEKLPYINLKIKQFPCIIPESPIGVWTLLDQNSMLFSPNTSSTFPGGHLELQEDHENPPSRAYLKIQEALIRSASGVYPGISKPLPKTGERCLDAGACPGGWTWVLRQLGATVVAIDRSPLVPSLMEDSSVTFMKHDAFTLKPEELGAFDWIFSDVICYPERLYEWVTMWLDSGMVKNMICTIKMQGETDWNVIQQFADIPGSKIQHLNYNKHELTWFHLV